MITDKDIADRILTLCRDRGAGKTICPSEVARSFHQGETAWRDLMPRVRAAAARLTRKGAITVTQKGRPVDPLEATGAIRLGSDCQI